MELSIRVDARDVVSALDAFSHQAPFAQSVALNRTAEEGLAVMRHRMREQFIVRVPDFDLPPQQIPGAFRAKKDRLWTEVRLGYSDGPDSIGGRRERIFSRFEEGGVKAGTEGRVAGISSPAAIPTKEIRPSPTSLVPRALYPVNLRLRARLDASGKFLAAKERGAQRNQIIKRGALKLKQADRTFELDPSVQRGISPRAWGVWERIGPERGDIRLIWAYRATVPIPKRLGLGDSIQALVDARYADNLWGAFEMALGYKPWAA